MAETLGGFRDALDHTQHVADRCHYEMEFGRYKYPVFQVPENRSLNDVLAQAARRGMETRLRQKENEEGGFAEELVREYQERLNFELGTICKMGFAGYFLIVADFIEYARRMRIPVGPGRGSVAGSLVAYCLNITNIDGNINHKSAAML